MVTHKAIATAAGTAYSQAVEKDQLRTKESRPNGRSKSQQPCAQHNLGGSKHAAEAVTDASVPAALERLGRFDCDFYTAENKHTYTLEDCFMPVLRKVHNRVLKNRDCYLPVSAAWTFFRLSMFFCKPLT